MDFLDPKLKRRHRIRLSIGYTLMGIVIIVTSAILVFSAYGFDVDRKTGEVIQNGLVFVDSAPDKAKVLFNNNQQNDQTNNRFALPSGDYELKITKDGYRDWSRKFTLEGGEVERYTYPMLIPNELVRAEMQVFETTPAFGTESPDRRWVVLSQGDSLTNFLEVDLNTLTNDEIPAFRAFALPEGLFTAAPGAHKLDLVEWSNDNKHLLVKHTFEGKTEFVVVSRDQPETSVNINRLTGQTPTGVYLKDKKFDQWYVYSQQGGILQSITASKVITPLLTGVTSFKTHGSDTILYSQLTADGKTQRVTLLQGKDSYVVKEVKNGAVFLEIARFDGSWYVVVGSDADQRTYIYRNPVNILQKRDGTKPAPRAILKATGPLTAVSFSQNTRFIVSQSGQHFEVFDAEANQTFKYDISNAFDPGTKVIWMDGHRLLARSLDKVLIFDFDGSNKQENLVATPVAMPVIFDRDYTVLYNIEPSKAQAGKTSLASHQLRLPDDK